MQPNDIISMAADEFVDTDFGVPRFLVQGLLAHNSITLISGKRGHGKTQLAMTLVKSLINGEPFLDRFETSYARVAYVSVDMPVQMLQDRLRNFVEELDRPDHFFISASPHPIDLMDCTIDTAWVAEINDFEPDMVIIDTLRKSHRMDENVAAACLLLYSQSKYLFPNTSLIFVHHDRKSYEGTKGTPLEEETAGTGAWLDNSDLSMHIKKNRNKLTVRFPRQRWADVEDMPVIQAKFGQNLLIEVDERKKTSYDRAQELKMRNPEAPVTDIVEKLMDSGVSKAQAWRAAKGEK